MNINLNDTYSGEDPDGDHPSIQTQINASREIVQRGYDQHGGGARSLLLGALLLPDEVLGVYQVWFVTHEGTFVHVTPDGVIVEQESILPEHFLDV